MVRGLVVAAAAGLALSASAASASEHSPASSLSASALPASPRFDASQVAEVSSMTSASSSASVASAATRRRLDGGLLDAADHRQPSTESSFDHMLDLSPEGDVRLYFHWNDPTDSGMFQCKLVHRAPASDSDAGWLGIGIYDALTNGVPESVGSNLMVGSQAVIGNVPKRDVAKYDLGGKTAGKGGVERMKMSFQTLVPTETSIAQHAGDDGHVNTMLSFEKSMKEGREEEIDLLDEGHNVLLFAVGPHVEEGAEGEHGEVNLGRHVIRGAFKINFRDVIEKAKSGGGGGGDGGGGRGGDGGDGSDERAAQPKNDGGGDTSAGAVGAAFDVDALNKCKSDDPSYLHMIHLAPSLTLHYDLDVWSDVDPPTVSVKLTYSGGSAWLGLGVSPDGNMIGSEAIIGRPDLARADGEKPLKYKLNGKGTTAVVPMDGSRQTLEDASIETLDGDGGTKKTVMKFKKLLREDGQHTIEPAGTVTFVYAIGSGDALAYHKARGSFRIDLSSCVSPDAYDPTAKDNGSGGGTGGDAASKSADHPPRSNRTGWVAHGILATLAWAVTAPFAVTTAWFRTLVPSSWIYVHVFANVATFALTLVAFIIAVVTMSKEPGDNAAHFANTHHVIGLAMLLLTTFQVMNGFLRPPVERRDPYAVEQEPSAIAKLLHLPDTARQLWKFSHRLVGALLLAFGLWQIATGCDLFSYAFYGGLDQSWKPYFYFYLMLFGVTIAGLRGWMWWEEVRARRNVDMMNPDQRQMGSLAVASGVDPNSELVPVQFDVRIQ